MGTEKTRTVVAVIVLFALNNSDVPIIVGHSSRSW